MVRPATVVVALLALSCAGSALGQTMDPREAQARKACLTGKVEEGIALLAELFVATGNPNFVFNQGRCYEQNARPEEALPRFREFLRIAHGLRSDEKADVERHIQECDSAVRERSHKPQQGEAMPLPEDSSDDTAAKPLAKQRDGGKGLRTAGIVAGIGGLLAVGAGVTFSLMTKNARDDFARDALQLDGYDQDKYDQGALYAKLQWVGYGVGAAALAGGVLLYVLGQRAGENTNRKLSFQARFSDGQYGVALWGVY